MRGDLRWGSIPGLVDDAVSWYGDREAVVDGGVRMTYRELGTRVQTVARAAVRSGLRPGDRAAIWAPNCVEWVLAALGLLRAGAVLVPLNTRFKGAEAAYVLRKSGARLLVASGPFLGTSYVDLLRPFLGDLPELTELVVLADQAPELWRTWDEFVAMAGPVMLPEVGPDDVSDIIFTSGTTGNPKGVMATHGQSLRAFGEWSELAGLSEGDRYLIVNPFFHTFGYKAGILAAMMRGATIVPQAVFDAEVTMSLVARERITVLPGPPALYQALLDRPRTADLGTLRLAVTGAAIVPLQLVERMRTELGFSTVLTAYGLTEATGMVTMCRRDDEAAVVASTSGRPIPGTEVCIVDQEGLLVPPGVPGEVLVRGFNVTTGYFADPIATRASIDELGWLHTGDVGILDEDGNLRITDRIKDMFIVGGFNAYPAEIELSLAAYPGVAEVAVVGVPDERLGEVGKAFVVPRPGVVIDPDEMIAWARDRLANYKVPRAVEVLESLPRNASGKVLKRELRMIAESPSLRTAPTPLPSRRPADPAQTLEVSEATERRSAL